MRRVRRTRAYTPDPITFADRLVSGIVSALLMAFLTLGAPLVVDLFTLAEMVSLDLGVPGLIIWSGSLSASTLVTGFMAGPRRMARFWGHLFGTEEPQRPNVTGAIWLGIAGILIVSCLVI
jgi:hypothetical protein